MVNGWAGIMAMLSAVECVLLLPVLNLFGWCVYVACCIVTVVNSFSVFGIEKARGKPFSERVRGIWLMGYVLMVGYFVLTLVIYAMD